MKNSFYYFENRDCQYYPCHKGMAEMNCLFCYCPCISSRIAPESGYRLNGTGR